MVLRLYIYVEEGNIPARSDVFKDGVATATIRERNHDDNGDWNK